MISRRNLIQAAAFSPIGLAALPSQAQAALPIPDSRDIAFRILRNGDDVGRHVLRFTGDDTALSVAIEIDIQVVLGPITVFRYKHRGTETWQDGRFQGMSSQTDDDGTACFFRAARTAEGMVVEGSKTARYIAPDGVLPTTYWNRAVLQDRVINSQDGRLFNVSVLPLGAEAVQVAAGKVAADHYQMRGDLSLDLWYDAHSQWAHLEFSKRSSHIIYEKL